ncbi:MULTISPECIES: phage portal protein, partial [unclassified Sporosarcina]|uniref:phage portal protein n=1 Tax=unclassified Sporosarcina TaxID=2647733 RepID=UPI00203A8F5E
SVHSTVQVAKAYGIPRHKFGLETSNMNLEQMNLDYLINTLSPYLESFTAELNFKCIPDADITTKRYWFDTDNQRIIDAETKSKIIKEDLAGGLISLNEARRRKGYPPIESDMGDKHLISLNFTTLEMIEEYQMAKAKNMPVPKGGEDNGE